LDFFSVLVEFENRIKRIVEGEVKMLRSLFGVSNYNGSAMFKVSTKGVDQFPFIHTFWSATEEDYWATFSGKDVSKIDVNADGWKIVTISGGGDEKPGQNGGVAWIMGVKMLIASVFLVFLPFVLFRF
jgi:hypothetical protein